MKNLTILILAVLVCALFVDDLAHRRRGPAIEAGKIDRSEVRDATRHVVNSDVVVTADLAKQTSSTENQASLAELHRRTVEITRDQLQKTIPLLYSRYFATAHLSKAKTDLLVELMIDRWIVGLEPEVQDVGADPLKSTKNDKLIEDLIGKDGLAQLDASRFSYLADQQAQDVIDTVFEGKTLSESQLSAVSGAFKGYRPDQGFGELMSSNTKITPETEQTLRSEYKSRENHVLDSLAGVIDPSDAVKFRSWSDTEFEKQLAFLKMIQAQKAGSG